MASEATQGAIGGLPAATANARHNHLHKKSLLFAKKSWEQDWRTLETTQKIYTVATFKPGCAAAASARF